MNRNSDILKTIIIKGFLQQYSRVQIYGGSCQLHICSIDLVISFKKHIFMHPNFCWIFFSIWLILGLGQGPFLQQKRPGFRPKNLLIRSKTPLDVSVIFFFWIRLNLPFLMYLLPTESIMSWIGRSLSSRNAFQSTTF